MSGRYSVVYRGEYDLGNRRTRYGIFENKAEAERTARELRTKGLKGVKVIRE